MIENKSDNFKEILQLFNTIIDEILVNLCDLTQKPFQNYQLKDVIQHEYKVNLNIHQAICYQQHTDNFCGYHSIYNTLCFLHIIKGQSTFYHILNGASFWRFKRKMQKFLFDFKSFQGYEDYWPWRQQDILNGDFQRNYNEVCRLNFEEFNIFRDQTTFEVRLLTWQFSFQFLLLTQQRQAQLNEVIQYFKVYQNEKPLILSFMLGITVHWMTFSAVKRGKTIQYWFFDSQNLKYLQMNQQQKEQYLKQLQAENFKKKNKPFSEFEKKNMRGLMNDTQTSLRLIIDCLEDRKTIKQFLYNQEFNIFAKKLQKNLDNLQILNLKIKQQWYEINNFFNKPLQQTLFSANNKKRLQNLIEDIGKIKQKSQICSNLYQIAYNFIYNNKKQ